MLVGSKRTERLDSALKKPLRNCGTETFGVGETYRPWLFFPDNLSSHFEQMLRGR